MSRHVLRCKILKSWAFDTDREVEDKIAQIAEKSTSPLEVHFSAVPTNETFPGYIVLILYKEEEQ